MDETGGILIETANSLNSEWPLPVVGQEESLVEQKISTNERLLLVDADTH